MFFETKDENNNDDDLCENVVYDMVVWWYQPTAGTCVGVKKFGFYIFHIRDKDKNVRPSTVQ